MKSIIYHHNDEDGWASAAIILTKYPESKLVSCYHGEKYDLVSNYDEVFVVDFTFSDEEMNFLKTNNKHFTWIDHHASAIKKIKGDFEGVRLEGKAACKLCWEYFYPEKETPLIIEYIAGFDVWDFSKKGTKEFILYLQTILDKKNEVLNVLEIINDYSDKDYEESLNKGDILLKYHEKITKKQVVRGVKQQFLEFPAMIYFANSNNSDLGNQALIDNEDIDVAVIIDYVVVDGEATYKYSLRSRNEANSIPGREPLDVSKIATRFGGGGHPVAAGFQTKEKLWEKNNR